MIFDGPQNLSEINRGLVQLMKKDGFTSLQQAVGSRNPLPIIAESESPVLTNVKKEAA
jgi:dihydroorotate dehydrogenase